MKKFHNFDEKINRINTDSFKWDLEGESGKYIPLGVADTDFKSPQEVINKIKEIADFGVYAYGDLPKERFSKTIQNWYKKRYNIDLDPQTVRYSQGLMTGALWMLINAYTRPGDKILIQPPVYNTFNVVIKGQGRFIETNNLLLNGDKYEIDFEDLYEKTKDPRVRILLVCNPHNPVGRVWKREELEQMAEICKKNNTLIISDEIHGDIVYNGNKHIPFFSLSKEIRENVIVMGSPSKSFNLAGFYSAYVIIHNKALRQQYEVVYDNYHFDYNYFGIEALMTSYNDCEYYVDQQNEYFKSNIQYVTEFFKKNMPEVKIIPPEGTYLLWIDFSDWNLNQNDLNKFFINAGVKLNNGENYGVPGKGFMRMNIATQKSVLVEALEKIKIAYDNK